jgi:hypothetical protein
MNSEPPIARKSSRLVRCLRWVVVSAMTLVTLIALFYAVENFRGRRAWEKYRKEAENRGAVFDFAAHVPPAVPDDQNAANIPLVHAWFDPRLRPKGDPTLWPGLFKSAEEQIASDNDSSKRRLTDLVLWQRALAAADGNPKPDRSLRRGSPTAEEQGKAATNVLAALQIYEPALEQMREAMKRPHMRYPVDYNTDMPFSILLPHLANLKGICSLLALRASANLVAQNSEAAFQDVLMALRLVESLEQDSFLITYVLRVACLQLATQPVWEGMMQHRWNEAQLKTLQERVGRLDFLRDLQRGLATERAAGVATIDWIKQRQSGARFRALGDPEAATKLTWPGTSAVGLMPRGWWDMEKVSYTRFFENQAAPIEAALKTGSLASAPEPLPADHGLHQGLAALWHHEILANLLLPALDKVQRKAGLAQALADQVVVACALERGRLAGGSYPQSLDSLTPKFLAQPRRDVMTSQPLIYRPEGDGYVLYSVGWNRTDEGGMPGKALFDDQHGDSVWRVAP